MSQRKITFSDSKKKKKNPQLAMCARTSWGGRVIMSIIDKGRHVLFPCTLYNLWADTDVHNML